MPPAFNLSHDQTLQFKSKLDSIPLASFISEFNECSLIDNHLVLCTLTIASAHTSLLVLTVKEHCAERHSDSFALRDVHFTPPYHFVNSFRIALRASLSLTFADFVTVISEARILYCLLTVSSTCFQRFFALRRADQHPVEVAHSTALAWMCKHICCKIMKNLAFDY
ncbi:MAG: hypothetical protein HYV16_02125, partial [Gammaproteobacteria bacterium]|nr:hypothetical protein [Gammaproteobacteria bacterium]